MENHHFSWENPLFLWSFSIAMLNYQRVSELGYPMFHHWLLIQNDHLGWFSERLTHGETHGSWTDLLVKLGFTIVENCHWPNRCSDGWDAQKRTLTLEYLRNLPEYQPPRFHLAYVTASNYLWTLYIYIYISIMKAFLFSLVKYTNLQIMMNMMNMTRSSIEYKSPFWLFRSPFFLVESC